jgi:hypothetical protein
LKKLIVLVALAVLMLAFFPEVQGKSQNADVKNGIEGGHHNTIVTNVDQVSQIANKNNIPYGQVKKIASDEWGSGNSGYGLSQNMNIQNQIEGGHHNKILVNGKQTAALAALAAETNSTAAGDGTTTGNNTTADNSTTTGNLSLSQMLNTQNQIFGGHHNMILLSSIQVAEINALSLGNLSQEANIYNQIAGGHHNVIVVGSSQQASLNGTAN